MATKKLGVNQELDQLFNRVLNKPEYENQLHEFGPFTLMFHSYFHVLRQERGFYVELHELYKFENPIYRERRYTIRNGFVRTFKDVLSKDVTGGFLERFREEFTRYLHSIELHEKLQYMPEKKTTTKKNKI